MNTPRSLQAKIVSHSAGLGAPCADDVRQRAAEIARINGHPVYTDADWQQAKQELHGGHESNMNGTDEELRIGNGTFRAVPTDTGHRITPTHLENEVNLGEELIAEGMDEAVHDQMLAASQEAAEA